MPKKFTIEDVKQKLFECGYILISDEYRNKYTELVYEDMDGYRYQSNYLEFYRTVIYEGLHPEYVNICNPWSLYNIVLWIEKENKPFSYIEGEYQGAFEKNLIFQCHICNKKWDQCWEKINSRGYGCPFCSGRRVADDYNLFTEFPDLMKEWDWEMNTIDPRKIRPFSSIDAYWICLNCGRKWESAISDRTFNGQGCKRCHRSKGEGIIIHFLNKYEINFTHQARFDDCRNSRRLPFDFYLPDYNLCIEFNGQQHYEPVDFAKQGQEWAEFAFSEIQKRDAIKENFCYENKIDLLIIPYWEMPNIGEILADKLNLN